MRTSSSSASFLGSLFGSLACSSPSSLLVKSWSSYSIIIVNAFDKLNQYSAFFFAAGSSFLVWLLSDVFKWVIYQNSTLLQGVFGAMQQACFVIGWMIVPITCIYYLVLFRAALLGVVWRGRFSSICVPYVNRMVGIFPVVF